MTAEAAFIRVEDKGSGPQPATGVIVRVECPSIGQRESQVLQHELLKVAESSAWRLILDMTNVTFLSSLGIGTVVTMHNRCKQGKGKLVLYAIHPEILSLLKLTRLDAMFHIAKDRDAAIKSLG